MRKTLTAGLTALSLIMVPAAPVQAETQNDALGQAIVGLLAAGVIGLAISKSRHNDAPEVQVHQPTQSNHGHGSTRTEPRRFGDDTATSPGNGRGNAYGRRVDLLPDRCFRQIELRNGRVQNVYASRCLDRRYRDSDRLPQRCLTRLGGRDGSRFGYEASCLRESGYRSDRRW